MEQLHIPEILVKKAEEMEQFYADKFPALAPLAKQCFLNTIETTVKQLDDGTYFVITGDIPAMWLRDSAAQVRPYVKYAKEDKELQTILEGIIEKQAQFVCLDPYANAFNESPNGMGHKDETELNAHVWERKYEVDSLCAPVYLAYTYWKTTGRNEIFTDSFMGMIKAILTVFRIEQDHSQSNYSFQRRHCVKTDTLVNHGKGRPVNRVGMTWSGFRPSDDCCKFGYLIPSNMMAVVALRNLAEICEEEYKDMELSSACKELAEEMNDGILDYAIVDHPKYGKMYAFETDGFGNYNLMDDANSPSLLSMPYLGYCEPKDPIYQNTRNFVLSNDNPYYVEGKYAKGIGSPHTKSGYVWHIGITMQALTSQNQKEIEDCLQMLSTTHNGTNFMHESFDPNDPSQYSREWFAWANTLFAELLVTLMENGFWN
jgi:meiotically up-regulated gene 157 (Mug157) protein